MKVLFDSNVIIDAISARPLSNGSSRDLFCLVASSKVDGYLVSKQITDIHYTLRKYIPSETRRREFISFLLSAFHIVSLEKEDLQNALALGMDDYEDAVLASSASRCGLDFIVSANQKDFLSSPVPAFLPEEALRQAKSQSS